MMCEQMTHRIKVPLYHRDGLGGICGTETRSMPWRPIGAGVCLAAGEQDEAGAEGFSPGPPPSPQRQLQGLILVQLAPLLMACVLLPNPPPKANQLSMAAKEGSRTIRPLLSSATN